ncbi:MAG TPA: ABC transporter ATP-binding protein [Actinomycetota bacterium]|nr:ABC transporter ATP-binding protein [Actinomycetota bacterium]
MSWGVAGLAVRFRGRLALSGVDLEVPPGQVVAVVGPDGAGKTTLLRAMAGALEPERGEVRRPPPERLGYVSAASGVYPDLTVAENLAFAAAAYRVPDPEERSAALLRATGLSGARDRLGAELSGGMRRKLGLAMALVHGPDLLVLDEPTTGLDPASRVEIWGLLAGAAADGAAVLLSTTYLEEAERAALVLVLEEGRPLARGSAEDVLASVPGAVLESAARPAGLPAWRRGRAWRAWAPDGRPAPGARIVPPDLEDAVMVAALARERGPGGDRERHPDGSPRGSA